MRVRAFRPEARGRGWGGGVYDLPNGPVLYPCATRGEKRDSKMYGKLSVPLRTARVQREPGDGATSVESRGRSATTFGCEPHRGGGLHEDAYSGCCRQVQEDEGEERDLPTSCVACHVVGDHRWFHRSGDGIESAHCGRVLLVSGGQLESDVAAQEDQQAFF